MIHRLPSPWSCSAVQCSERRECVRNLLRPPSAPRRRPECSPQSQVEVDYWASQEARTRTQRRRSRSALRFWCMVGCYTWAGRNRKSRFLGNIFCLVDFRRRRCILVLRPHGFWEVDRSRRWTSNSCLSGSRPWYRFTRKYGYSAVPAGFEEGLRQNQSLPLRPPCSWP